MPFLMPIMFSIGTLCFVANDPLVIPVAGAAKIVLPELIDGCEQVFAVEIVNNTESQIDNLRGAVSCGCLGIDVPNTSVAANAKVRANILVRPSENPIGQFVRFSGVVDSKDIKLGEVHVIAPVRSPFVINKQSFMLGEKSFGASSLELKPSDGIEIQKVEFSSDSDAVKAIWTRPHTVTFSQKSMDPYDHRTIFPNSFERSILVVHFKCGQLVGKKSKEIVFSKPRRAQIFPSTVEIRREESKSVFTFLVSNFSASTDSLGVVIQLENRKIECDLTVKSLGASKHFCTASPLPNQEITKGQKMKAVVVDTETGTSVGEFTLFTSE
ncbi:hypothetical protein SH501x_000878 [Pirellulaceae bacterium SH501]